MLIDDEDHPSNSYTVSLGYSGFSPSGTPTVYTLANNATTITSASGSATSATVAPYSLTVVHPRVPAAPASPPPARPASRSRPAFRRSTSGNNTGTATLTWPASVAGTYPVANYQVYSGSTLVTTTTGTSVTLTGLTIGTSYTCNVVAVDSHGNPSLPSPLVTFTVPPRPTPLAPCITRRPAAGPAGSRPV